MTKSELRKIYFEKRGELSPAVRAEQSRRIAELFFEHFDLVWIRNLHLFITIEKFREVDTSPILRRIWSDFSHIRTSAPRVDFATGEMEGVVFTAESELIENSWGIREPSGGEPLKPEMIDMVLVPLLCFDRRGHRVGYGKGFYDRFLKKCRPECVKIGLSFFPPIDEIADVHPGDIMLDYSVTPSGIDMDRRA